MNAIKERIKRNQSAFALIDYLIRFYVCFSLSILDMDSRFSVNIDVASLSNYEYIIIIMLVLGQLVFFASILKVENK